MHDDEIDKEWKELMLEGNRWVVKVLEVKTIRSDKVIVTKSGMKVKVVPGKCQDCCFRVDRGLTFCDCQGEIPEEYLIEGGLCNLHERKFVVVKAKAGI